MSNEIAVAQDELIADFELFEDWMDRYQYLIDLGRRLPEFPDELRTEENRIRGCGLSQTRKTAGWSFAPSAMRPSSRA